MTEKRPWWRRLASLLLLPVLFTIVWLAVVGVWGLLGVSQAAPTYAQEFENGPAWFYFLPDARHMLIGGGSFRPRVLDTETGEFQIPAVGHVDPANTFLSADGRLLLTDHFPNPAAGTAGEYVLLLDSADLHEMDRLPHASVGPAGLAPDAKTLTYLSGGLSAELRRRDLDVHADLAPIRGAMSPVQFAPDASTVIARDGSDGDFALWDTVSGGLRAKLPGTKNLKSWSCSRNGRLLAAQAANDSEVIVWDSDGPVGSDGAARRRVTFARPFPDPLTAVFGTRRPLSDFAVRVAFSSDSGAVAVAWGPQDLTPADVDVPHQIWVWEAATGRSVTLEGATSPSFTADGQQLAFVAWHGPAKREAALMLWDRATSTDRVVRTYAMGEDTGLSLPGRTCSGNLLAVTYRFKAATNRKSSTDEGAWHGETQIIDAETGWKLAWLPYRADAVASDGSRLAAIDYRAGVPGISHRTLRVYDLSSRSRLLLHSQWPMLLTATTAALVVPGIAWGLGRAKRRRREEKRRTLTQRFKNVKRSANPRRTAEFLRRHRDALSARQQLDLILIEQAHHWAADRPRSVREYLAEFPAVAAEVELTAELVAADMRHARHRNGDSDFDGIFDAIPGLRERVLGRLQTEPTAGDTPAVGGDTNVSGLAVPVATDRRAAEPSPEPSRRLVGPESPVPVTYAPLESGSLPATGAFDASASASVSTQEMAEGRRVIRIGRYAVEHLLGEGGFGSVYLARDEELGRPVAIKVPKRSRIRTPGDVRAYMAEARALAALDHPAIVPVYDVGHTDDGLCFVVSKFIAGSDLAARLRKGQVRPTEVAAILGRAAEGLHHAHQKGLVHRDVKPSNLLLDMSGNAYVADFGLALAADDRAAEGHLAGTPAYMSPEQARGAARLDGRSDVFSLGVVLYEMLTGERPFCGRRGRELLDNIALANPRPPHLVNAATPAELARICMRCLAKDPAQRFSTAGELAIAFRRWQRDARDSQKATSELRPVPRALAEHWGSFDADDMDFYLELLPPHPGGLLPPLVGLWKERLESAGPDEHRVLVIAGPAGAGKSSLVRAGVLPRLANSVLPIHLDAALGDVERRLFGRLDALTGGRAGLPGSGLPEAIEALGQEGVLPAPVRRVLVVLDQFDGWLLRSGEEARGELLEALTRCHPRSCRFLLLVREPMLPVAETWLRAGALVADGGTNVHRFGLLTPDQAKTVLTKLGVRMGRLPEDHAALLADQKFFLSRVVSDVTGTDGVLPLWLARVSWRFRDARWTAATYGQRGGLDGCVAAILADRFAAPAAAPVEDRLARTAAKVLGALLPPEGFQRAPEYSARELRERTGCTDRPDAFDQVMAALVDELRLVAAAPGTLPGALNYHFGDLLAAAGVRLWLRLKPRASKSTGAE